MHITPPGHTVPMEASVSLGKNWRDLIELGANPNEGNIQVAILEALE